MVTHLWRRFAQQKIQHIDTRLDGAERLAQIVHHAD
jgi:hypothetical protein